MNESLKPLGLISIALLWVVMIGMTRALGRDNTLTFSKHAATHKKAFIIFGLSQAIAIPMLLVFSLGWFAPMFQLPVHFDILVVLSGSAFLVASWLPDTGKGIKSAIHGTLAYSGAMLIIPITTIVGLAPDIGLLPKFFAYMTIAWMTVGIAWSLSTEKADNYALHIQAGSIVLFDVMILTATYLN